MNGDATFTRLQRAHGNLAEHVPFVLVLSLLGELSATPRSWVLSLGGVFWLARLAHVPGIARRIRLLHVFGAATTYSVEAAWGILLLGRAIQSMR